MGFRWPIFSGGIKSENLFIVGHTYSSCMWMAGVSCQAPLSGLSICMYVCLSSFSLTQIYWMFFSYFFPYKNKREPFEAHFSVPLFRNPILMSNTLSLIIQMTTKSTNISPPPHHHHHHLHPHIIFTFFFHSKTYFSWF